MNLLKIIMRLGDIVPAPTFRGAAALRLVHIIPRKIFIRNCKALNKKCLQTFLPQYQLPKRLKILGKLYTLQRTLCDEEALLEWVWLHFQLTELFSMELHYYLGEEALLEWVWLQFQLTELFSIELHYYLGAVLLFPIMALYYFHSSERNVFPMSISHTTRVDQKVPESGVTKEQQQKEE